MSESKRDSGSQPGQEYGRPQGGVWQPPTPGAAQPPIPAQYGQPPVPSGNAPHGAPFVGQIRKTGTCILLCVVTFGIYSLVWYFKVHDEMKKHSGAGLGGPLALVLALFIGVASPFLASSEIGQLYQRRGQVPPVNGWTGLWVIPGFLIIVGPIVWFVQTNRALNDYWESLGATA